jgi:hypothetical protein
LEALDIDRGRIPHLNCRYPIKSRKFTVAQVSLDMNIIEIVFKQWHPYVSIGMAIQHYRNGV